MVDDLLPAVVIHLRELAQLVEYRASLCVAKLGQLFDDFGCAHCEIIASVDNLSGKSLTETFFRLEERAKFGIRVKGSRLTRLEAEIGGQRSGQNYGDSSLP